VQRLAVEKFHGDEWLAIMLINFIDSADIRMIQGRGGAGNEKGAGVGYSAPASAMSRV
jgi:hypothetical protein